MSINILGISANVFGIAVYTCLMNIITTYAIKYMVKIIWWQDLNVLNKYISVKVNFITSYVKFLKSEKLSKLKYEIPKLCIKKIFIEIKVYNSCINVFISYKKVNWI